jgi:hypothetical protein
MDALVLIALGTAMLAVAAMCWTGRWRAWSRIAMLPAVPIALLPGVGLCLLFGGIGVLVGGAAGDVLLAIGIAASVAGFVLAVWGPRWYGPRWFRERDTTYDLSVPINAAIASSVRGAPAEASEAVARARMGRREPDQRWRAHLVSDAHGRPSAMQRIGVVRGHLLLYPDALVFAADANEDRMRGAAVVEAIPAAAIVGVRRVPAGSRPDGDRGGHDLPSRVMPRVRIDTTSGAHVFETRAAGRRAQELEARYLGSPLAPR